MRKALPIGLVACLLQACSGSQPKQPSQVTVAAASNLTGVFDEIASAFRKQTGVEVVMSYGATAQLAQQIDNGAPFDVFAAADTEHIDQLIVGGRILADSRAIYARGQLALWVPEGEKLGIHSLQDLAKPEVRFISIAQPELAPYGKAAVDALQASGVWEALQPKIVYANNINMARQYAATGNANAALTAYSLVWKDVGTMVKIDPKLHRPLDQALGVVVGPLHSDEARQFADFVVSPAGSVILRGSGYQVPNSR